LASSGGNESATEGRRRTSPVATTCGFWRHAERVEKLAAGVGETAGALAAVDSDDEL
jgi:hypothetical protein